MKKRKTKQCAVCGAPVVARGLCQRCYVRDRRGLPPSRQFGRARNGEGCQVAFRMERYLRHLVTMLASQEGVLEAEWFRRAVTERADRQLEDLSRAAAAQRAAPRG
jgi:hypothetical protein